ncbi:PEP/pyruvate-binding domain-containing protein [Desulfosporosinus nitroreducens]|uniref:PEP-utilizing enzyme n=1 Tax=Desulfosporosinus nitroreducens TaxID=2018668 RepID=A0ABT8QZI8_9FIRM|nr:PEP/pyruvate-binding domain-containing protein [Desulfosporosinus nitroreducens]MDO0825286.1 PEP-utilizing enzyme [Desulfosporosinus nitroreducens]
MQNRASNFVVSWREAFHLGVSMVGGKAWNLSRLERYGFKIPYGWVLTTTAYQDFLDYNQLGHSLKLISRQINGENLGDADTILYRLREQIINATLPPAAVEAIRGKLAAEGLDNKAVAVRSSASAEDSRQASFAGIHDTFLNVRGLENITEAIKGCYASLWTPRAAAYRRKQNIDDLELMPAVIIMEMAEARSAGVAFSCDPQSGRRDVYVINANFGLGESVVSGAIKPDTYFVAPSVYTLLPEIRMKQLGSKSGLTQTREDGGVYLASSGSRRSEQVLSDEDIKRLSQLITRVFDSLGNGEEPQDIEWAFDGNDFVLVQARPVTTLPDRTFEAIKNQPTVWSNANYRDAVPMVVSPLHKQILKDIIDTIWITTFSDPGYPVPDGIQFSRFFNGRLYCNMSAVYWAHYDCNGTLPHDLTFIWGGHQPEIEIDDLNPFEGEAGVRRQKTGMRTMTLIKDTAAKVTDILYGVTVALEDLPEEGFKALPDHALIDIFKALGKNIKSYSEKYPWLSGAGGMPLAILMQDLFGVMGAKTPMVINGLMAGGGASITSADQGYRLVELAEQARQDDDAVQYFNNRPFLPLLWEQQLPENSPFKQAFRKFIKEYGHRTVYELDIINPRWQEDPTYLFDIIRTTMATANLDDLRVRQKEKFNQAWAEITALLPVDKLEEIHKTIVDAQRGAGLREMTKSVLVMALQPYRSLAIELGDRFARRNLIRKSSDIFFCTWPEILSILGGEWNGIRLKSLVKDRIANHKANEKVLPPDIIQGNEATRTQAAIIPSGNYLQGVGAAAGKATGTARLINHPDEGNKLQPGEVMIAPSTDPGWTPLFLKAEAVVMETGGYVSHGAIVAREYGIPSVINVPGVMKAIQDGQTVTVDGDEGRVYINEASLN